MDNRICHTKGVNQNTQPITQQLAEDYLKEERNFEDSVNNKSYVPRTINQNQFDALVAFAFNLGEGNLHEICTASYPPGKKTVSHIASEITLYNNANNNICQGLANRREKEKKLFLGEI